MSATTTSRPTTAVRRPSKLGRWLRTLWYEFRSMRTALVLLFLLAAGSVFGSLLPQTPIDPAQVVAYIRDHPAIGPLLARLGMFDVFDSAWFTAVYVALVISLIGCLVPRLAAHLRNLRAPPRPPGAELRNYRNHAGLTTAVSPELALATARDELRRRRFRVAPVPGGLAAEKGYLREAGSLLFHVSLLLLLLGIAYGRGFGFRGEASIVAGSTWADARVNYDSYTAGRFFGTGSLPAFELRLLKFRNAFYPNGEPSAFVSSLVATTPGGAVLGRQNVSPNRPMTVDGVRVYQTDYGYAPVVRVSARSGQVLQNGPVVLLRDDTDEISSGAVKLPTLSPQVGLQLTFFTGLERVVLPGGGSRLVNNPRLIDPTLLVLAFTGNLQANVPQSVFSLDTTQLRSYGTPFLLHPGQSATLPDGVRVALGPTRQYSVLTLTRDPGIPAVAAAGGLLIIGLLGSLYVTRRRIWVEVAPAESGSRVELGGLAMQGKDRFAEEFRAVADRLAGALGSAGGDRSTLGRRTGGS